jgi:hypothetical protein
MPLPVGYSGSVSFCLREWEFCRVICAWRGEEDHHKLPRFGTDGLPQ